ncbi:MAG: BMP family ABC transporter substrate-binding protein [Spirochaetaceae bacterium]|jgi:simple sugar transport system substrate-binding protein|nr:BMP family ABC transporter substrate-binding protein [Spirochaetaceae bacterium]
MKENINRKKRMAVMLIAATLVFAACKPRQPSTARPAAQTGTKSVSIAVFIPGAASGSPIYEMLAEGVKWAADERNAADDGQPVTVQVIEGGYNQAEWEAKLTALAASGAYDLIVSSNPSLPELARAVRAKFPAQRFLLLDGELSGDPGIYTLRYNQREQAYMAGYLAALVAAEAGGGRVGLIAAQEYPAMLQTILPGYREGALAVDPGIAVDFRVVGNWYDAAKCAELAAGMIKAGARVLLCVAGGANEGAVQAAVEAGTDRARIVWFDTNGYAVRPPYIVGSCVLLQDRAAYSRTKLFLEGKLSFGEAEVVGIRDAYVDFIEDDPLYAAAVSDSVRKKQHEMLSRLRSGELILEN